MLDESALRRFWSKVQIVDDDDSCWPWTGLTSEKGYGLFTSDGKTKKAHRVSFVANGGVVTKDKPFVLHTCDNPPCVRPKHLYAGTHEQNVLDAVDRGGYIKTQEVRDKISAGLALARAEGRR